MARAARVATVCAACRGCRRDPSRPRSRSWLQASRPCSSSVTSSEAETMYALLAFVTGLLFGFGLIVSGMANPAKVLGFLDIAGRWDPSLALVMAGANAVGLAGFAVAAKRRVTLLGT